MVLKDTFKEALMLLSTDSGKVETHFKKEWTDIEIKGVEAILFNFMKNMSFRDNRGNRVFISTMKNMSEFLGLAYTSCSGYGILNVCNSRVYLDTENKIKLEGFCIRNNADIVFWCQDEEECNYYFFFDYDFEY